MTRNSRLLCGFAALATVCTTMSAAQVGRATSADSTKDFVYGTATPAEQEDPHNQWGVDFLISTDGFGLGGFYRRLFTPDLTGFVTLSVSESKDSQENEQIDPYYGVSFVPGKLNRFLVLPLLVGIQQRLFREDIMDTFRPYVSVAAGPALIFMSPFVNLVQQPDGTTSIEQVEFFKSLGKGTSHYTASAYIGFGADFGSMRGSVFGLNFRYYFTYLLGDGLPSRYDIYTGAVAANKKSFGGFFITINMGMAY
jgi:hypothetical protein